MQLYINATRNRQGWKRQRGIGGEIEERENGEKDREEERENNGSKQSSCFRLCFRCCRELFTWVANCSDVV